jgi:hypothetical protein
VRRARKAREAARQHAGRALHVYQDEDGTMVVRGRLTPEAGALLLRALDAARERLYQQRRANEAAPLTPDPATETPTRAQQQADALVLLAETALHHALDGRTAKSCPTCPRRRRCPPIRPQRSERRTSRRGSSSMRARASPSGSGSGWMSAGRSTCYIRGLGDPPDLRSRYRQACSTGLPGRRSSPTAMAMFNRFHRIPLTNAVW